MAAKIASDFFESYDEEFFGLDVDTFDLSFSKPVPEHGEEGQNLFTDGSGVSGWGGIPYNQILKDDFTDAVISTERWTKTGSPTIGGGKVIILNDGITGVHQELILDIVKQIKVETNFYQIGGTQADYGFQFGFISTTPDCYILLYQDNRNSDQEHFWFSCWNDGDITEQEVYMEAEVNNLISIIASKGKAKLYKNNTLITTIKSNIPIDKELKVFAKTTNGNELDLDYIRLKILMNVDAF